MTDGAFTIERVGWRNSLITRVTLLCVALLLALLVSVYIMSRVYFNQLTQETERQTRELVENIRFSVDWDSDQPISEQIAKSFDSRFLEWREVEGEEQPISVSTAFSEQGPMMKATADIILENGKHIRFTFRYPLTHETEILRVMRNKWMIALTMGFALTLGGMVYLIWKTLRPLSDLTELCAAVSSGNLKDIEVRKNYGEVLALEKTFNRMVKSLREKEKVEANLRQAQRLSALGNLAAGIAHDVRNPLNAIKLLSSHALDSLGSGDGAEPAAKHLNTIRDEVGRLEEILAGFLSLAKDSELKLEPCHVDSLLEECARLVRKDAEQRAVRLITELRAGDTTLMLDPKQWKRAVLNVLINAMEACPEGGRVRLFSRINEDTCEIEVRDDGPGMDRETLERAFEPYFTTKSTGTGLGLSITRGVVEEHGGSISISSAKGQGCQALITIPMDRRV